ncbi:MAG TPA: peptidylprolyl isomerase [Chthoniobacterales bacterium]|nr:peptidylprolyl isomerase [Chthoniobacterales bacterium]
MNRIFLCIAALLPALAINGSAQNQNPVVVSPIGNVTVYAGAPARTIDLTAVVQDADRSPVVRMNSVFGPMGFALFDRQKPITTNNFLRYVDEGRYFVTDPTTQQRAASFIHRSVVQPTPFVIQGGGFIATVNPSPSPTPGRLQPTQVAAFPPIQNEPGISNRRATVAMAKLGDNPNSATSQWFINLADNGGAPPNGLDHQNGGFTVFARVIGNGMDVADRIANLPTVNFGSPFDQLPVRDYTSPNFATPANVVTFPQIERNGSVPTPLTFSATSNNSAIAEVKVSDTNLVVSGKANGTTQVTVTGTDIDGATVSDTFDVEVINAPGRLVNISTRLQVRTADEVLIGGFIMRGDAPKRVMVRAIGPSLSARGIEGVLADPQLELYDSANNLIAANDSWADANKQAIIDTGIAPTSTRECAILATLPSNNTGIGYTAIVRGAGNTNGIALVEVYDLDAGPGSTLLNIATRGRVGNDNERVMIGGFFLGGTEGKRILVRALGPSLASAGVTGTLSDPRLELVDGNGNSLQSNNDWQTSTQADEIQQSGLAPRNSREAALIRTLNAGPYTAIVRGAGQTTGVASVEIYQLP